MIKLLVENSNLSAAKVRSKLLSASDAYLTAEEVVALGIADDIIPKKS
jgi:ATP-dependent protease ClpP protease subunit